MITLIAAVADNGVIGNKGKLPWRVPEDLTFFRKETLGGAMIMGRKTYESLPAQAFDNRIAIVLSRCQAGRFDHAFAVCDEFEATLKAARRVSSRTYLIGGVSVFEQGLPEVDRILLTRIKGEFEGDTYLPPLPLMGEGRTMKLSDRATVHEYLRN